MQSYSKLRICEITQEMLQNKTDFHKKSFLKSGSIFAFEDTVWLMWGEPTELEERPSEPSICPCDFFLDKKFLWLKYPHVISCEVNQALQYFDDHSEEELKTQWSSPEKGNFEQQFSQIKKWFHQGVIEKAVPYIFEKGKREGDGFRWLEKVLHYSLQQNSGFLYGNWNESEGRLGLTPEVLIEQKSSKEFSTMAVAGTTTLSQFNKDKESFLKNPKENKEHDWVVNDINHVLSKLGLVNIGQRKTVETPSLVHLKTDISVAVDKDVSIEDLVLELHPTPALGVFPRSKNREVMGYLNKINSRGKFGAPFGFSLSKDKAHFVVAIRNIEWSGFDLRIGAGCGVVPDSHLESEWVELREKRKSVKQIFGLI